MDRTRYGPTVLALQLEHRGLVNVAGFMVGAADVQFTDEGRVAVHQLKSLQKGRAARLRYSRLTLDSTLASSLSGGEKAIANRGRVALVWPWRHR
ncbi:hypothetical protein ACFV2N_11935 [Streptomyces sp. NPDC059680]|uniref:hypothetical protein n=1 Tax=Streptomyces sp. NPDC059680 TaxID=3346904 RepID=UPI003685E6EA